MTDEHAEFFDSFCRDFREFDGNVVARRYATPYVAATSDGELLCFSTQQEIARYFQGHLDRYKALGCTRCSYSNLEVVPLGQRYALATVTWQLCDAADKVLSTWRESYNLRRIEGGMQIYASTDHVR